MSIKDTSHKTWNTYANKTVLTCMRAKCSVTRFSGLSKNKEEETRKGDARLKCLIPLAIFLLQLIRWSGPFQRHQLQHHQFDFLISQDLEQESFRL